MSLHFISAVSAAGAPAQTVSTPSNSFRDVLSQQQKSLSSVFELPKAVTELGQRVLSGKEISLSQMLLFQTHMHQLSARIELTAKAADGFIASVRKLQNQQ